MGRIRFRLRCTAAERDAIRAAAAAAGMSMAAWIRAVIAGELPGIAWPARRRRAHEPRQLAIELRLAPEDHRSWSAAARRHDLPLGTYLRLRLLGQPAQPV